MNKDGKWRFTSPTHVVLAFSKALDEILEEGGIAARSKRYSDNNRLLIQRMKEMGMETYIEDEHQGPIITTFLYQKNHAFAFQEMYEYIKERVILFISGKITETRCFHVETSGEITRGY